MGKSQDKNGNESLNIHSIKLQRQNGNNNTTIDEFKANNSNARIIQLNLRCAALRATCPMNVLFDSLFFFVKTPINHMLHFYSNTCTQNYFEIMRTMLCQRPTPNSYTNAILLFLDFFFSFVVVVTVDNYNQKTKAISLMMKTKRMNTSQMALHRENNQHPGGAIYYRSVILCRIFPFVSLIVFIDSITFVC